jgi:hypothetical protein
LAVLFASVIIATQFSFGQLFKHLFGVVAHAVRRGLAEFRRSRDDRRRARERREVIAKHVRRARRRRKH